MLVIKDTNFYKGAVIILNDYVSLDYKCLHIDDVKHSEFKHIEHELLNLHSLNELAYPDNEDILEVYEKTTKKDFMYNFYDSIVIEMIRINILHQTDDYEMFNKDNNYNHNLFVYMSNINNLNAINLTKEYLMSSVYYNHDVFENIINNVNQHLTDSELFDIYVSKKYIPIDMFVNLKRTELNIMLFNHILNSDGFIYSKTSKISDYVDLVKHNDTNLFKHMLHELSTTEYFKVISYMCRHNNITILEIISNNSFYAKKGIILELVKHNNPNILKKYIHSKDIDILSNIIKHNNTELLMNLMYNENKDVRLKVAMQPNINILNILKDDKDEDVRANALKTLTILNNN